MRAYRANKDSDALGRVKSFSISGLLQTEIGITKDKNGEAKSHKATNRLRNGIPMSEAFQSKNRFALAGCLRKLTACFRAHIPSSSPAVFFAAPPLVLFFFAGLLLPPLGR